MKIIKFQVVWNLRSSDDRAFDRQSKGPGLGTQRSGSVPFVKYKFRGVICLKMTLKNLVMNFYQEEAVKLMSTKTIFIYLLWLLYHLRISNLYVFEGYLPCLH